MNINPEELWVNELIGVQEWKAMGETEREAFVAQLRRRHAAALADALLKKGYIEAHDSQFRFDCGEPSVMLSSSIRVGYVQRTVYGEMLTRMMLRELWTRFWSALW